MSAVFRFVLLASATCEHYLL